MSEGSGAENAENRGTFFRSSACGLSPRRRLFCRVMKKREDSKSSTTGEKHLNE